MTPFAWTCSDCGATYERDVVRYLCPACGASWVPGTPLRGVLLAEFDGERVRAAFDPAHPDWTLLSAVEPEFFPPYAVGNTPLTPAPRLGADLGLPRLHVKNDGLNPSGSLKDRASFLVVAEAIRLGEPCIVAASTGNAGSALAAVCAAAGRQAVLYVPASAPRAKLLQARLYGADLHAVDGTYDDAFRLSIEHTRTRGGLNRNTAYHPLTIEGKKTVALEMWADLGGRVPDAVVVPVGDGVILAGVWKGFRDLVQAGIATRIPRLVAVQAERSDAIHRYVHTGVYADAPAPSTVADSISVCAPSNAHLARRAIVESGGTSVTVTDAAILDAQAELARTTGVFAEPAAAAGLAGLRAARAHVDAGETVVLLVTGHGLKDVEAPLKRLGA